MQSPCTACGKFESLYGHRLCLHCLRKHSAENARANRRKQREKRLQQQIAEGKDPEHKQSTKKFRETEVAYRMCKQCVRPRELTEYERLEDGSLSDTCDRCRLAPYLEKYSAEQNAMFGGNFWRRRAYSINTTAWRSYAKENGLDPTRVRFDLLPWVCKPRHLAALYERQGGRCAYCGKRILPNDLGIDHKTPRSRGGLHAAENLALVCKHCNGIKHVCTESEFYEYLKRMDAQCKPVVEAADKEPQR